MDAALGTRGTLAIGGIGRMWASLRLLLVMANVVGVLMPIEGAINIAFWFSLSFGCLCGIVLFAWLTLSNRKIKLDVENIYRWGLPFYPMKRYPIRYWLVASESILVAGMVGLFLHDSLPSNNLNVSIFMFSLGVALLLSILSWVFIFGRRSES